MASVYVHLGGGDVEQAVLSREGVTEVAVEKQDDLLKPRLCLGCGENNPGDARHCLKCGLPLDQGEAEKLVQAAKMMEVLKNPQLLEYLIREAKKLDKLIEKQKEK